MRSAKLPRGGWYEFQLGAGCVGRRAHGRRRRTMQYGLRGWPAGRDARRGAGSEGGFELNERSSSASAAVPGDARETRGKGSGCTLPAGESKMISVSLDLVATTTAKDAAITVLKHTVP